MNTLVWLASYPKSGNTWLRAFFANYTLDPPEPIDINRLDQMTSASARWWFDLLAGFSSARLALDTADNLRPAVFRWYAQLDDALKFLKVHDAPRSSASGEPLFPPEATRGAIYIVRNPVDVAVSYAYHENTDFDHAIEMMSDPEAWLAQDRRRLYDQFPEYLGTWSTHVRAWTTCASLPVHVVRYEDIVAAPSECFAAMLRFIGLPEDRPRLEKAIAFSSFRELQQQESRRGFHERKGDAPFFRSGRAGSGGEVLTARQIERITADHEDIMVRFRYL